MDALSSVAAYKYSQSSPAYLPGGSRVRACPRGSQDIVYLMKLYLLKRPFKWFSSTAELSVTLPFYALPIKRTKTQWWVRCLGTVLHGLVNTLGLCISASGFSFICSPVIKHDEMVRSQDEVAKILGAFLTPLPLTPIASF